jgi:hypothetical protein
VCLVGLVGSTGTAQGEQLQALKEPDEQGLLRWLLVNGDGEPVEIVGRFLRFLQRKRYQAVKAPFGDLGVG